MPVNMQKTTIETTRRKLENLNIQNCRALIIIDMTQNTSDATSAISMTKYDIDGIPRTKIKACGASEKLQEAFFIVADRAVVGTKLRLTGTESDVTSALSWATSAGFESPEIQSEIIDGDPWQIRAQRRIFCAHCHNSSLITCKVGDEVTCPLCQNRLSVYYHFSLSVGGYLGYRIDAEEL